MHEGVLRDSIRGYDVIDCNRCGFTHIAPVPAPEDIIEIYQHEYYAIDKPDYLENARKDLEWNEIAYRERFDAFERLLPFGRRRVLDVGCGPGFFLAHGASRGWHAVGVEPSKQAAAHARSLGVEVVEQFFDVDVACRVGPVDVVQMTNVLEHVRDPQAVLAAAYDALSSSGLISIVVPNDYSPFQDALRSESHVAPWWLAPPHHVNYFTFDSLAVTLDRAGFDVLERTTTFPIDLFLLMGDDYVGNAVLGRACHERRMRFERTLARAGQEPLRRDLYRALASLNLGREVVMLARRR